MVLFFGTLSEASEILLGESLREAGVPRVSSIPTDTALVIQGFADRLQRAPCRTPKFWLVPASLRGGPLGVLPHLS